MTQQTKVPAVPSSPRQHERRRRILAVAIELASRSDTVAMQDVADQAGVALGTLYRYFPSKAQLFLGVVRDQIDRMGWARQPTSDDPATPVHASLVQATRYLVARPTLAAAVMEASGAAAPELTSEAEEVEERLHTILLAAAGRDVDDPDNRRLMRLVVQNWYGVLQTVLNGRLSLDEGEQDLRMACHLLLAPLRDPVTAAEPSRVPAHATDG